MNLKKDKKDEGFQERKVVIPREKDTIVQKRVRTENYGKQR